MKMHALSRAMAAVFKSCEDRLSELLQAFRHLDWQVGAVFAINREILGLECYGCADTFVFLQ